VNIHDNGERRGGEGRRGKEKKEGKWRGEPTLAK